MGAVLLLLGSLLVVLFSLFVPVLVAVLVVSVLVSLIAPVLAVVLIVLFLGFVLLTVSLFFAAFVVRLAGYLEVETLELPRQTAGNQDKMIHETQ